MTSHVCGSLIITLRIIPGGAAPHFKCIAFYGENPTIAYIPACNSACEIATCEEPSLRRKRFQLLFAASPCDFPSDICFPPSLPEVQVIHLLPQILPKCHQSVIAREACIIGNVSVSMHRTKVMHDSSVWPLVMIAGLACPNWPHTHTNTTNTAMAYQSDPV